ncbi:hypothetical protein [Marivirga sp.]|uniref:hypothetical protein n=1 Tax=Marivirga sp. TaxID=2018662 RepID=UPI002D7F7CCC|nr:hypothetical protein [Marivirga sp.]HET8861113.1 hypothetical protein [Marivirga sp.]
MKNIAYFSLIILAIIQSCTFGGQDGEPGPVGPVGPPGVDGQEAFVFEYIDLTFSSSNDYSLLLEYPSDFQMLESDKVLVYFLYPNPANDEIDLWRLLPQTEFTNFGTLVYNYDFTMFDTVLFLYSNFDLNLLDASYTDNWIARVVVIPGQLQTGRSVESIDYENYQEVIEYYNIKSVTSVN